MKIQNIALDDIVPNPWRDIKLYPIDSDHVSELRESINDHGFFGGVKGRRRNGKVEIGCGHMRIAAARKAKLGSVPIFIDDMDDDTMLLLMTDENATQAGANPGAVLNEVASVTRRLIGGLLGTVGEIPPPVRKAFENEAGIKQAIGRLRNGTDVHLALGHVTLRRYLGQGKIERSHRKEEQVRQAITTLKQSGRYDDMVDEIRVKDQPASKSKDVERSKPRKRILDERCANLFPNEHQFNAFREAVTTPTAQKFIPVSEQYPLARQIVTTSHSQFSKKSLGAPQIKRAVQTQVQQALKAQRDIDKEEKERYLAEQREERINDELDSAQKNLRGLISALARMADLVDQFPGHPKLGGFAARLDTLVDAIKQFSKKLK